MNIKQKVEIVNRFFNVEYNYYRSKGDHKTANLIDRFVNDAADEIKADFVDRVQEAISLK